MLTIKFETQDGVFNIKAYSDDYMEEPLRKLILKLPNQNPRAVYVSTVRGKRGASAFQIFGMSIKELRIKNGDTVYVRY